MPVKGAGPRLSYGQEIKRKANKRNIISFSVACVEISSIVDYNESVVEYNYIDNRCSW